MINWTEEDLRFFYTNILQPALEVTIKGISEEEAKLDEITDRIFKSIGDVIKEIRYEQERDRRFYKVMFSEALVRNQLFTPAGYDAFYKSWCEEFDKLNKEKFI